MGVVYVCTFFSSDLEVIKQFSCSTRLSTKFIMLIIVEMQTIVTFISMIKTKSERLKARKVFDF